MVERSSHLSNPMCGVKDTTQATFLETHCSCKALPQCSLWSLLVTPHPKAPLARWPQWPCIPEREELSNLNWREPCVHPAGGFLLGSSLLCPSCPISTAADEKNGLCWSARANFLFSVVFEFERRPTELCQLITPRGGGKCWSKFPAESSVHPSFPVGLLIRIWGTLGCAG